MATRIVLRNLEDTFVFKLGFTKTRDERGRLAYRKQYGAGVTATVTALGDADAPVDNAFTVTYRNEPLGIDHSNDCETPMGGEFWLSNQLEMAKNQRR